MNTTIQIQCRCFHLTNFAVLVVSHSWSCVSCKHLLATLLDFLQDISERIHPGNIVNPPFTSEINIISIIGISLSLFGLVTTVITLISIKWDSSDWYPCVNLMVLQILEKFGRRMYPSTTSSCVVPSLACCWCLWLELTELNTLVAVWLCQCWSTTSP